MVRMVRIGDRISCDVGMYKRCVRVGELCLCEVLCDFDSYNGKV